MRIVIDLDGTLCSLKKPNENYGEVQPNLFLVEQIREWKKQGHVIIIYTARHMKTMNNNEELVRKKIGDITINWLQKHNIPYDEIYFGKPYGDIYIDDLALPFKYFHEIRQTFESLKINIIITMAGKSSRFFNAGYKLPKYMINVKHKSLFEWALESLPLDIAKNIMFVCLKEHDNNFHVTDFINKKINTLKLNNVSTKIVLLENPTNGQAETAYNALQKIKLKSSPILIYNIDSYFKSSKLITNLINMQLRGYDGLLGGFIIDQKSLNEGYSYITVDENDYLISISEKQIVSKIASTGLYVFNNSDDFKEAFENIRKNDTKTLNEFYVSDIYNYLIKKRKKFIVDYAEKFISLGTPEELTKFEKDPITKFD